MLKGNVINTKYCSNNILSMNSHVYYLVKSIFSHLLLELKFEFAEKVYRIEINKRAFLFHFKIRAKRFIFFFFFLLFFIFFFKKKNNGACKVVWVAVLW